MAKLSDFQFLENVLIQIFKIATYLDNYSEEKFLNDPKTTDAVRYCILQIGKNVACISDDLQKRYIELSGMDWAILGMFNMDGYFMDEDFWNVLHDEKIGIYSYYSGLETIYLKERQKPENKEIAVIPARLFKKDDVLPLKSKPSKNSSFGYIKSKSKGFNPRNHITTHFSIWTVRKK